MYKIRFQSNYTLARFDIVRATENCGHRDKAATTNDRGEYTMQQIDTIQPVPKASAIFNRLVHFIGGSRLSTPQPDQSRRPDRVLNNIDWPDSNLGSGQPSHGGCKRPVCGGYNEAFIVQYWTSYHLR